jgi:hypothetical protein
MNVCERIVKKVLKGFSDEQPFSEERQEIVGQFRYPSDRSGRAMAPSGLRTMLDAELPTVRRSHFPVVQSLHQH